MMLFRRALRAKPFQKLNPNAVDGFTTAEIDPVGKFFVGGFTTKEKRAGKPCAPDELSSNGDDQLAQVKRLLVVYNPEPIEPLIWIRR